MTRVLVVDDHQLFRRGVVSLLREYGFKVAGEAGNGAEAIKLAETLPLDVILMDMHMPGTDGVEAIRKLAWRFPILVLSVSDNDADLSRAIQAGASGYVLKHIEPVQLIEAVQRVVKGHETLSPELTGAMIKAVRSQTKTGKSGLSSRETQVLELIAKGCSNADIAQRLHISASTVKTYTERLYEKLGVNSRSEAAAIAGSAGLTNA